MEDVLIKIGASGKQFIEEMEKIEKRTADFSSQLKTATIVAGAEFAVFTGIIAAGVMKFNEHEAAARKLESVLVSTGGIAGVTAEQVNDLGASLAKSTIFSKGQVKEGEQMLLTFTNIGKNIFPAATKAMLDLAQSMGGDTAGAAQKLGLALEDPTTGIMRLRREGITFTSVQQAQIKAMQLAGDIAGAQAIVLEVVAQKTGGLATAAAQGGGQITKLNQAMGSLTGQLGEHFAPTVNAAAGKLLVLVTWVKEHPEVMKFAAASVAAGAAVSGLALAAGTGALAFLKIRAALLAANVATGALTLGMRALVGATGIGLVLIVAAEVAMHWDVIWPKMQEVFHGFVSVVSNAAAGLGKILAGALVFHDLSMIKKGWDEVAKAYAEGGKKVVQTQEKTNQDTAKVDDKGRAERMEKNRAAIAAERALQAEKNSYEHASLVATNRAAIMEYQQASTRLITLKKEEARLLKEIGDSTGQRELAGVRAEAQKKLALMRQMASEEEKQETDRAKKFHALETKNAAAFQKLSVTQQKKFNLEKRRTLQDGLNSEEEAQAAAYESMLQKQVEANNTFLANQTQFGSVYANIYAVMHSKIVEGTGKSLDGMTQMTQSHNSVLKTAGRVAATGQITMRTAQAAMDVYSGFQSLPFGAGIPLGIAAAGLVTAYGAEQIGDVWKAAEGGVMMGGTPGRDSIHTIAQQYELISPAQNFEEVIGSVAAQRAAKDMGMWPGGNGRRGGSQTHEVTISIKGQASQFLTAQVNADKALGRHRGVS